MVAAVIDRSEFYRVLTEAVDDLLEHGFTSQKQLDEWLQRIELTARAALVPEAVLQRSLQDALTSIYRKTVTGVGLERRHKGLNEFTLAAIKPKLRAELDRRIVASANLIRMNREASIQRTLQRFAGWATSVPAGGSDVESRREVKQQVRRGIAGLPFEERRVIVDQSSKMVAAVDEIIAVDGGAIAAAWRHVKEGPPAYDARPEHVARDGKVFVFRDNWALKRGLMKLGGAQYTDQIEAPAQLPFCRCRWGQVIYSLRDLPVLMLTERGRQELRDARRAIKSWDNTHAQMHASTVH